MSAQILKNPWKGLDYYKESETLYGRDAETESLYEYIRHNSQVVLYGRSGIGKSSIINAGIFPKARRDALVPVPLKLSHTGAVSYLNQIKDAVRAAGIETFELVPAVSEEQETLWEFFHRHQFFNADNRKVQLLLVLDQFEEIFTLQTSEQARKDFFSELGDLINDVMPQYIVSSRATATSKTADSAEETRAESMAANLPGAASEGLLDIDLDLDFGHEQSTSADRDYLSELPIHLVLTIREDFLSYLERYTFRIPAMRDNRFPLLPLNEEQAVEVITRPAPGLVSKAVAQLVITKITGRDDFTFDRIPELEVDAAVLSLYLSRLFDEMQKAGESEISADLVERAGTDIISRFYEDCVSRLPVPKQEELECQLLTRDNRRNNVSRTDFMSSGFTDEDIRYLVDDVKLLRQFSLRDDLRLEYIHDILCPVVRDRREQREQLRRQEEENRLVLERERKNKRRLRIMISSAMAFLAVILSVIAFNWIMNEKEIVRYYSSYECINGWPEGVGEPLTESGRAHMALYYRLSKFGYRSEYNTNVEVCSSYGILPNTPRVATPFEIVCPEALDDAQGKLMNGMLSNVRYVHFTKNEAGRIDKVEYQDENESILFIISYFHQDDSRSATAQFVSPSGQALKIRENGLDRVKLSWDESGRIAVIMYYDERGVSRAIDTKDRNAEAIRGYLWQYPDEGQNTVRFSLNQFGRPTLDPGIAYNVVLTGKSDDGITTIYQRRESFDSVAEARATAELTIKRDDLGNVVEKRLDGDVPASMPAVKQYKYDPGTGFLLEERFLSSDGAPFGSDSTVISVREWQYDGDRRLVLERHENAFATEIYRHEIRRSGDVTTDIVFDRGSDPDYVCRTDSSDCTIFSGRDGRPINRPVKIGDNTLECHKYFAHTTDSSTLMQFYRYSEAEGRVVPMPFTTDGYTALTYFTREEKRDADGNVISMCLRDTDGRILKSMMYFIQNGQQIGRAVCGIDGTPVRSPDWEEEGFGYYKLYFTKNYDKQYVGATALNEYDAPSALMYDKNDQTYYDFVFRDLKGSVVNVSGYNTELANHYEQILFNDQADMSDVSAAFLHMKSKDSSLYKAGLKDNDIIVSLDGWRFGMPEKRLASAWESLLSKDGAQIEILRYTGGEYEALEFTLPRREGDGADEAYYMFRLTEDEWSTIEKAIPGI